MRFEFAPTRVSPASVSDYVITCLDPLFDSLKVLILTVLIRTIFSFTLCFHIIVLWLIIFPFHTLLVAVADFNLGDDKVPDIASIMLRKWSPVLFRYTSVELSPVFYWYNG